MRRRRGLGQSKNQFQAWEVRLKNLADSIDRLADKDAEVVRRAREMGAVRRAAAAELYGICSGLAAGLNRLLARAVVVIDPPDYDSDGFREESANLIQMNVRGRILQVEFEATPELVSTEDFRIPYILKGFVRGFNQELLDKDLIEEQLLFYTLEKPHPMWRFFESRTYRSGPFNQEYLVSLLEELV